MAGTANDDRDGARRSIHPLNDEGGTQRFSLGLKRVSSDGDDATESLQELLKQTWNVSGVSCFFGFRSDELQLKLYGKKMREEVSTILPHEDVTYDASFEIVETMSCRPSVEDPPPLKVEIIAKTGERGENEKNIYTGYFMSWRTILAESRNNDTIKLPLLLCRGTKSAMNAAHLVISQMFDCHVVVLTATEDELEWLLPMMLNPTNDNDVKNSKEQINLEYRMPGFSASETIGVKFPIAALWKLWNTICENDESESETDYFIRAEHVSKFHEVVKKQMLSVSGIQLGLCNLHKISLPFFTMMENRIRASNSDAMHRFLLFFNDKSLKTLHTLDYDPTQASASETFIQ